MKYFEFIEYPFPRNRIYQSQARFHYISAFVISIKYCGESIVCRTPKHTYILLFQIWSKCSMSLLWNIQWWPQWKQTIGENRIIILCSKFWITIRKCKLQMKERLGENEIPTYSWKNIIYSIEDKWPETCLTQKKDFYSIRFQTILSFLIEFSEISNYCSVCTIIFNYSINICRNLKNESLFAILNHLQLFHCISPQRSLFKS